ncbi:hypothetical protein PI124_g23678 [Phytophthora idaei]|nr:hypothetical protein PI124_g23678 [Phytophthora idaei]
MATAKPATREAGHHGSQDVEMESVGEVDLADLHEEFDPDDLDFPSPSPAAVVAMTGGGGGSSMIQRVRISAISDLKEFTGKDQDEDRARAWIGKVKSTLMRDQASGYQESPENTGSITLRESGFDRPKWEARSTMRKRLCFWIVVPRCPYWTPPLLVR